MSAFYLFSSPYIATKQSSGSRYANIPRSIIAIFDNVWWGIKATEVICLITPLLAPMQGICCRWVTAMMVNPVYCSD
jgi:hypothetical protein